MDTRTQVSIKLRESRLVVVLAPSGRKVITVYERTNEDHERLSETRARSRAEWKAANPDTQSRFDRLSTARAPKGETGGRFTNRAAEAARKAMYRRELERRASMENTNVTDKPVR